MNILALLLLGNDSLTKLLETVMDEGVVDFEGVIATTESYRPIFVVYNIMIFGVVILIDGERESMAPKDSLKVFLSAT